MPDDAQGYTGDWLTVPGGMVPTELRALLGSGALEARCRNACILDARGLLLVPEDELIKTPGVANGIARQLIDAVWSRWQIEPGCLATPATAAQNGRSTIDSRQRPSSVRPTKAQRDQDSLDDLARWRAELDARRAALDAEDEMRAQHGAVHPTSTPAPESDHDDDD